MENVACKSCGCAMNYVENARENEFYKVKVDTWVCGGCNKIVEEPRYEKILGVVWK